MNYKKIIGCLLSIVLLFIGQFLFIDYIKQDKDAEQCMQQSLQLTIGDSVLYDDLLEKSRYKAEELSWSANENNVVCRENDFTCESSGRVTVTAKKGEKTVVSCDVNVISRSTISLESSASAIGEGLTVQITALIFSGNETEFAYSSEDSSVAAVNESGLVTAVSAGKTRIKVSCYGCESVFFNVDVYDSPSYIALSAESIDLGVGEEHALSVLLPEESYKEIAPVFSSDNESVAVVDENGTVTAIGKGSCSIKATAYSGAEAVCLINVNSAPSSVSAEIGDDFLYAGESVKISVAVNKGAACGGYTFTSSDPAVADVSLDGVIIGKGRGDATIEVSTYNGKKDKCKVSVQIFDYTTSPKSQDIYDAVGYLADFYPDLISKEKIGASVKGKDIILLKLGKGQKKACIVAGLHAKEDIAVAFTMRCIEEYAAAYYSKSGKYGSYNMKKMLDEYTLYIVPLMNPDGLDICNSGEMPLYTDTLSELEREKYKSNANGVNLNRNFPFIWDNTISEVTQPDNTTYKGDKENSEPETQTIVKLVENNDFEWLFSMHCKGYFVYWADEYNKITEADKLLSNRLEKVCGYGLKIPSPLKNLGGGLENWFRYKTGKPGFCVELVAPDYSTEVNKYFSLKTNWTQTKYTFIQGMR